VLYEKGYVGEVSTSRVRTPKDNSEIERFDQTLDYEWLYDCKLPLDSEEPNPRLTDWVYRKQLQPPAPISWLSRSDGVY